MKQLLAILVLLSSAPAFGHGGHVHEPAIEAPPHGGLLRDAAPFKAEVVLEGDLAKVYIYDQKLKPVKLDKPSLKGDMQFPRDKQAKPVTFTLKGDHYEGKLEGISKVHRFDLHVHLEVGDQKSLGDFGIDNVH